VTRTAVFIYVIASAVSTGRSTILLPSLPDLKGPMPCNGPFILSLGVADSPSERRHYGAEADTIWSVCGLPYQQP
jgi:hypothetical protein